MDRPSGPANESTRDTVLEVSNLTKRYRSGSGVLTVLDNVSFALRRGDSCAIVGPSGSGKTTLLGLSAGLDRSTSGDVRLCGELLGPKSEDERALLRNRHVGFVFQSFSLIPTLTAVENVMVPSELRGDHSARDRALGLLGRVGLGERTSHYPAQLSGGEQQRVAIARAFINDPTILFADEPTGELDTETGHAIADLLFELNEKAGTTLVLVTHDQELAGRSERIIRLGAGAIVSDSSGPDASTTSAAGGSMDEER
jgi:putative ABC transport system ATP-binding protein